MRSHNLGTIRKQQLGYWRERLIMASRSWIVNAIDLSVVICGDRSKLELLVGLRQQILGAACVPAEVIVIVHLSSVDPLPRSLNVLLSGPQISVPLTDVYDRD
jgi:hypothetical protein